MSSALVPASWIGDRFSSDPDLLAPLLPRLIPELVIVPFGKDGFLFEGAKQSQVIRGRSTRAIFPRLFSLLDGTRTLAEICDAMAGHDPNAARDSVYLLYSRGLLEDGHSGGIEEDLRQTSSFVGRFIDVTRVNHSRREALSRLADTRLVLAGNSKAASLFESMLAGCGIGEISMAEKSNRAFDQASFAVVIGACENDSIQSALLQAYHRGIPAMHIRIARQTIQIGPVFYPPECACVECMGQIYEPASGDPDAADLRLGLSLAALQFFQIISRLANPHLFNAFQLLRKTSHGLVHEHCYLTRLPGCRHCGPRALPLDISSPEYLTWVLNTAIAFPARHLYDPAEYQGHFRASNVILTSELSAPYYGTDATSLPPAASLNCNPPWMTAPPRAAELTLSALGTLLRNAVGYQTGPDGSLRRIAPTGGGLASPDLFVAALRVPGLDAGLYHYDAPRNQLEKLPYSIDSEWSEALAVDGELPPCVLIGTGAAGRLYMKYQNFSFRILFLDAGVVQAHLLDVAHALGLTVQPYDDIADASLARILRLATRRNQNIVTFAFGIDSGSDKVNRPDGGFSPQVYDQVLALRRSGSRTRIKLTPSSSAQVEWNGSPGLPLGEVLRKRRSVREFAGLSDFGDGTPTILEAMHAFNALSPHRLRFWLALRERTSRLKAGMYRFSPDSADPFFAVRHSFHFEDMLDLVSQRNIASAPAVVLCTGDLGAALRHRGARGYSELLMCAGGAVARGLMAATSLGFGACPFGGIFDSGLRRLTETDGYKDCPLFGFVFGEPKRYQAGS